MKNFQKQATEWINSIQYLINYSTVAVASLAGGYVEMLAHVRAGNGYELGIALSFVSVAALTVAALTKDKWAWGFYVLQLAIGVSQMHSLPQALLSMASLPAAYAAGTMLAHSLTSRQKDKSDDREYSLKAKEIELKHTERMERIKAKNGSLSDSKSDSTDSLSMVRTSESPDWNQAEIMRINGSSLREISESLGVSYGKVQRHFKNKSESSESSESLNESAIHTNGVYTP